MSFARFTKMGVLVVILLYMCVKQNIALSTHEITLPLNNIKSEVTPVDPKNLPTSWYSDKLDPYLNRFNTEVPQYKKDFIEELYPQTRRYYHHDSYNSLPPSSKPYLERGPDERPSFQSRKDINDASTISPNQRRNLDGSPSDICTGQSRKNNDDKINYVTPNHPSKIISPELNKEITIPRSCEYHGDRVKTITPTIYYPTEASIDARRQVEIPKNYQEPYRNVPKVHSNKVQIKPNETLQTRGMYNIRVPHEVTLRTDSHNLNTLSNIINSCYNVTYLPSLKPENTNTVPENKANLSNVPAKQDSLKMGGNQEKFNKKMDEEFLVSRDARYPSYSELKKEVVNDRPRFNKSHNYTPNIWLKKNNSVNYGPKVSFEFKPKRFDQIEKNEKTPLNHSLTSSFSAVENKLCNSNIKKIFEEVEKVNDVDRKTQKQPFVNSPKFEKVPENLNNLHTSEINTKKGVLDRSKLITPEIRQENDDNIRTRQVWHYGQAMQNNPWATDSNGARNTYEVQLPSSVQSNTDQSRIIISPSALTQPTFTSVNDHKNYKTKPFYWDNNYGNKILYSQHSFEDKTMNIHSIDPIDKTRNKLEQSNISIVNHPPISTNKNPTVENQQIYNTKKPALANGIKNNVEAQNHLRLQASRNTQSYLSHLNTQTKMENNLEGVTTTQSPRYTQDIGALSSTQKSKMPFEKPTLPYSFDRNYKDIFHDNRRIDKENLLENTQYINNGTTSSTFNYYQNINNAQNIRDQELQRNIPPYNQNIPNQIKPVSLYDQENISCNSKNTSPEALKSPDIVNNVVYGSQAKSDLSGVSYQVLPAMNNIPKSEIHNNHSVDINRQSTQAAPIVDIQVNKIKETQHINNNLVSYISNKESNDKSLDKSINVIKANPLNTDNNNCIKYYTLPSTISSEIKVDQHSKNEINIVPYSPSVNIKPVPIQPAVIQQPPVSNSIYNYNTPQISNAVTTFSPAQARADPLTSFYESRKPKITVLSPYSKVETKNSQDFKLPSVYYMPRAANSQVVTQNVQNAPSVQVLHQNNTDVPNTNGFKNPQDTSIDSIYPNSIFPTDQYTSLLSTSLNNIASVIVTNILSSINTDISKALKQPTSAQDTLSEITLPSILPEKPTKHLEISSFEVNHPCIESPRSLPETSIKPIKQNDWSKTGSSNSESYSKPKSYISSITINVLPSVQQRSNDVIILV